MADERTEAEAIMKAACHDQIPQIAGKTPFLILPNDYRVESLTRLLEKPLRHKANVDCYRLESFIELVNYFKTSGTDGRISMRRTGKLDFPVFRAIIDARSKDEPSWHDHTYNFATAMDPRFDTWLAASGKSFSAREFARFIEANRKDVFQPESGKLLDLMRSIKGSANVTFSEDIDELTGARGHTYAEKIVIKGGQSGNLDLPGAIKIKVPVYDRQEVLVPFDCLVRAEVVEGKVKIGFEIDLVREIVDEVMNALAEDIAQRTKVEFLHASTD